MKPSEYDDLFKKIMDDMISMVVVTTEKSTQEIFKVSGSYLEDQTHEFLKDFYDLYFSDKLSEEKDSINSEVDDLIDQALEQKDNNEEITLSTSAENEEKRLRLSAIQKKLEGLITLNKGIREQLTPIMSSIQFEDAIRQRLAHIGSAWQMIIEHDCDESKIDFAAIEKSLSSLAETKIFYEIVYEQEPPADLEVEENAIFMF